MYNFNQKISTTFKKQILHCDILHLSIILFIIISIDLFYILFLHFINQIYCDIHITKKSAHRLDRILITFKKIKYYPDLDLINLYLYHASN